MKNKICRRCDKSKKPDEYVGPRAKVCIECRNDRNNMNYHHKMDSPFFRQAERFRRMEKHYRRMKEKYLKLFYES